MCILWKSNMNIRKDHKSYCVQNGFQRVLLKMYI